MNTPINSEQIFSYYFKIGAVGPLGRDLDSFFLGSVKSVTKLKYDLMTSLAIVLYSC